MCFLLTYRVSQHREAAGPTTGGVSRIGFSWLPLFPRSRLYFSTGIFCTSLINYLYLNPCFMSASGGDPTKAAYDLTSLNFRFLI